MRAIKPLPTLLTKTRKKIILFWELPALPTNLLPSSSTTQALLQHSSIKYLQTRFSTFAQDLHYSVETGIFVGLCFGRTLWVITVFFWFTKVVAVFILSTTQSSFLLENLTGIFNEKQRKIFPQIWVQISSYTSFPTDSYKKYRSKSWHFLLSYQKFGFLYKLSPMET